MADLRVTTISGADTVLADVTIAAWKQRLHGHLITPDDADYVEACPKLAGEHNILSCRCEDAVVHKEPLTATDEMLIINDDPNARGRTQCHEMP